MAEIAGQQGAALTNELAQYLQNADGEVSSDELAGIINEYLSGGDQLSADGASLSSGIYKRFNEFDQISGKVEVVTTGLWTGDTGSLTTFFTSSAQVTNSGNYYYNVYNSAATSSVQFAVAYGHVSGSGSVSLANNDDAKLPSKATYNQYRTVLLDQTDALFTVLNSSGVEAIDLSDIYVINLARARYKESIDAGNWSLNLSGSAGKEVTLIDNSGKKFSDKVGKAGRVFDVVSGSLNLGTDSAATINSTTASNGEGWGKFYPDQGFIILNPTAISASIGLEPDLGVNADSFTGSQAGFLTDTNHQNAKILEVKPERIREALSEGKVPVVGGSQGVSVENDQGEGRYVTLRGMAGGLNAVAMNGALVPSPEGGRKVLLDGLPVSYTHLRAHET